MKIIEIIILSIALAMDAFAVSVCKGLSLKNIVLKKAALVGAYFGFFQGLMPVIGYYIGISFQEKILAYDHWIAFFLLCVIGLNMIKESISRKQEEVNDNFGFKEMLILSVATSIDALAVGVTFAFLKVNILLSVITIGIITFIISAIGVKIGNLFGKKYEKKAEFIGGAILIILGIKIVLEHLNKI